MSSATTPALVTQRGARRLPRLALLLLCAAYVVPGVFGRDPWRNADLVAFAQMVGMAQGKTAWLQPTLGGVPLDDAALLPYWIGAGFIAGLSPWVDAALAARIPFALLLAATLALVWYATFHLARTEKAQPLPFAFGGEAEPIDYARAIADGALLAVIATLGLLLLGHEITPELVQLFAVSLYLYALAAAPYRTLQPRLAVLTSLLVLGSSGAPSIAMALGVAGTIVCWRSAFAQVRGFAVWVLAAVLITAAVTSWAGAWRWRAMALDPTELATIARQWLWFLWPAWPFVIWTLWRWRGHLLHRHISVPLTVVLVALSANLLMGGSDRALMLSAPGMAALAAFALPTFKRGTAAAIDWFSMFFFTLWALSIWVIYTSVHTGVPAKPAANVAKLAPGFAADFALLPFVVALLGSLAWIALVRWRTGRHREALWKSLVLPAGGVALCWLLLMTLGLPALDYARSMRPWSERLSRHLPPNSCVWAPGASAVTIAALQAIGNHRAYARPGAAAPPGCPFLLRVSRAGRTLPPPSPQWELIAEIRRPTDREELTSLYRLRPSP